MPKNQYDVMAVLLSPDPTESEIFDFVPLNVTAKTITGERDYVGVGLPDGRTVTFYIDQSRENLLDVKGVWLTDVRESGKPVCRVTQVTQSLRFINYDVSVPDSGRCRSLRFQLQLSLRPAETVEPEEEKTVTETEVKKIEPNYGVQIVSDRIDPTKSVSLAYRGFTGETYQAYLRDGRRLMFSVPPKGDLSVRPVRVYDNATDLDFRSYDARRIGVNMLSGAITYRVQIPQPFEWRYEDRDRLPDLPDEVLLINIWPLVHVIDADEALGDGDGDEIEEDEEGDEDEETGDGDGDEIEEDEEGDEDDEEVEVLLRTIQVLCAKLERSRR
jgi:hypothetical protein